MGGVRETSSDTLLSLECQVAAPGIQGEWHDAARRSKARTGTRAPGAGASDPAGRPAGAGRDWGWVVEGLWVSWWEQEERGNWDREWE